MTVHDTLLTDAIDRNDPFRLRILADYLEERGEPGPSVFRRLADHWEQRDGVLVYLTDHNLVKTLRGSWQVGRGYLRRQDGSRVVGLQVNAEHRRDDGDVFFTCVIFDTLEAACQCALELPPGYYQRERIAYHIAQTFGPCVKYPEFLFQPAASIITDED
jgi:hypothetical protein